jgi:hypothetical protein
MNADLKMRAYELLIAELQAELLDSYKRIDANSDEDALATRILVKEILRLSSYDNMLALAKQIDKEVYNGKCNFEDYIESSYCPGVAA